LGSAVVGVAAAFPIAVLAVCSKRLEISADARPVAASLRPSVVGLALIHATFVVMYTRPFADIARRKPARRFLLFCEKV
jgi:hypothetical protein